MKPTKLDTKQAKLWSDTRVALLWHCPAFSHILYTMLDTTGSADVALFTEEASIAATDGSAIILNPKTFFEFNLDQRMFIVAHEIFHCMLNHMVMMHRFHTRGKVAYADGKSIPYDHDTMNKAMDYVINAMLVESNVGQMPTKDGKQIGLYDPGIAVGADSAIDTYRKIYREDKCGPNGGGGGFDEHLAPGTSQGKDPTQASNDRDDTKWSTEIAAGANAARLQGKLPASLDRLIGEILDPVVDWRDKIQGLFARKVGSGSYDWRKPDRRLIVRDIIAPGRSGFGCGTVVVGADTSGSVGDREVAMFFAEIGGILEELSPERVFIVWCDAEVNRVDEVDDVTDLYEVKKKGAPGGGGTSFVPVFEWMEENGIEPDALIYLTDGMGSFPAQAPTFPVIWGSIYAGSKYPFGDVVDIPVQSA